MPRARLLVVGLAVVLVSAACGDGERERGPVGRLSVVHEDDSGATPVEGALTVLTLHTPEGERVYVDVVRYPGVPDDLRDGQIRRRYDLLRDVEVPAGRVILRFDVRACSMACPDPREVKLDPSGLDRAERHCKLVLDVSEGESREAVVVWDAVDRGAPPCRLGP